MSQEQVHILPLCLIMVMGPQIVTAVFLITSRSPVRNSLAMLAGVFIGTSVGLAIWTGVVRAIGLDPGGSGSGPGDGDYAVAGVLALLAVHTVRTRGTADPPKWMMALQEAEPRRAFTLALLLILFMPTDIAATVATANYLHDADLDPVDGWPLVAGTLVLMAIPFLAYSAIGHRARDAMPAVRDWLTNHAWLVNLIVIAYFIVQVLT